ncbi:ABC transporter permease [Anaerotaenia torta]|uniref:ABC transporter permease n=1 Tax=Anaerotaenia torta TaxID=433293 RepID=UPI003D1B0729
MVQYILKRISLFIPTLILISLIIFFVIQLPPGDYVNSLISARTAEGEVFTAEEIAQWREYYGLDDPWHVQYFNWTKNIITKGDFGYSFIYGQPVWAVISRTVGMTIVLTLIITIFQYGISIPIAIYSSTHQYSIGDYIVSFIGFFGQAVPNFLLAIVLMYWSFQMTGSANLGLYSTEMLQNGIHFYNLGEFLKRLIIPVIVIGTASTCGIIRTIRAQMLDEQSKQYVLAARSKGISEKVIIYKYCLRASLNPVVSGIGGMLSHLFSGSTVTAMVLNLQILGPELLKALKAQDMYLAGTIVMVQAVLVVAGTLLSDIMLAWLDPRIRYTAGRDE